MVPASGSMLTPSLRLLSLLGRGGMGSVWLAEHLVLRTEVAVKLLSPELAHDTEALSRFRREATAIAQLKSPHVVRIHDVGSAEGTPFFVMERLEGEDLAHRLDRVSRLPLGVVTAIVAQMCKALARVHEAGVVHRDLKPGNVFLTDVDGDLVVKLVDFGIAKQREPDALEATSDGAILGTPIYMSPEQVLSTKDVTPASDLYSLAVVAYECLAGDPPFSGETLGALHVAIANGEYTPITVVDPSLPKTLDAWFARALSAVPEARFGSAQEMAETFLAAARGRGPAQDVSWPAVAVPVEAGGATMVAATGTAAWVKTLPIVASLLAVIALAIGVALGLQSTRGKRAAATSTPTSTPTPTPTPTPTSTSTPTSTPNANANANANAPVVVPAAGSAPVISAAPPKLRPKKDRGF